MNAVQTSMLRLFLLAGIIFSPNMLKAAALADCEARCPPNGSCKMFVPGNCYCDSNNQPRCDPSGGSVKSIQRIEDANGKILADDEESIMNFIDELDQKTQSTIKVSSEK